MGIVDAVSVAGSLKIKPIMQYGPIDYNSIRVQMPRNDVRKFRCCSKKDSKESFIESVKSFIPKPIGKKIDEYMSPKIYSYFYSKENFIESYKSVIPNIQNRYNQFWSIFSNYDPEQWFNIWVKCTFGSSSPFRHIVSIQVVLDDEHGQLMQKIDDLVSKENYISDNRKRVDIVLDEVFPLLLENVDRWITTDLLVLNGTPNLTFCHPLYKFWDLPTASDIIAAPNRTWGRRRRAAKVFVDLALVDELDRKYEKVGKVPEFKALLHHLMARHGILNAFAVATIGLEYRSPSAVNQVNVVG